jgi:lipid-A-disaccharide synthase-like uncharacterized protein
MRVRLLALAIVLLTPLVARGDLELSDRLADLEIEAGRVVVDGTPLSPDEFVALVDERQGGRESRGWLYKTFDITGPLGMIWVATGLLGQAVFTGRMLVQWLASERARRSTVPTLFWWMSLAGAAMLLAYFIWRTDIVGILGQGVGFVIYARNLWLIRTAGDVG